MQGQWSPRLVFLVLCGSAPLSAALTPQKIFDNVRARVETQVKKAYNYTCVQTIDRTYYTAEHTRKGCGSREHLFAKKPFMHDRLRLDVAVSSGTEIFSWHGGKTFSSKGVTDVVQSGPIASGSFVGYLQNIFFRRGVHILFNVRPATDGRYHFSYDIPLSASAQIISGAGGKGLTPYSGEFTADKESFDLTSLKVVIDRPPKKSRVCYASSDVEYQTLPISGEPAVIPKRFSLEIEDLNGFYTTSESTYQSCRAFTGESTISFDADSFQPSAIETASSKERTIPPGVTLPIHIQTPIDEMRSFTGDPVEGVLTRAVRVRKKGITLPKGATVTGVVTRLETHFQPAKFYVLSIRFDHLAYREATYAMEAIPVVSRRSMDNLHWVYGPRLSEYVEKDMTEHVIISKAAHLHLDRRQEQNWMTVALPKDEKP